MEKCDAVYLVSVPQQHEEQIRKAIDAGKHVLVESPIATNPEIVRELFESARQHQVILMESIKTAYATAYDRLLLHNKKWKDWAGGIDRFGLYQSKGKGTNPRRTESCLVRI